MQSQTVVTCEIKHWNNFMHCYCCCCCCCCHVIIQFQIYKCWGSYLPFSFCCPLFNGALRESLQSIGTRTSERFLQFWTVTLFVNKRMLVHFYATLKLKSLKPQFRFQSRCSLSMV